MNKKGAQAMINWLDQNQSQFTAMADQIWRTPELAWKEFQSSRLQADYLENEGFSITWDIGEEISPRWMNTSS